VCSFQPVSSGHASHCGGHGTPAFLSGTLLTDAFVGCRFTIGRTCGCATEPASHPWHRYGIRSVPGKRLATRVSYSFADGVRDLPRTQALRLRYALPPNPLEPESTNGNHKETIILLNLPRRRDAGLQFIKKAHEDSHVSGGPMNTTHS
jgi:hypothetical protein